MFSTFILASIVSLFAAPAHADQVCYDVQVCGDVCTTYTVSPTTYPSLTVSNARTLTTRQLCHTECDVEQVCTPEDYTNGGEGYDYSTDDIDACYQEQLLVDQIRCIQMLGS